MANTTKENFKLFCTILEITHLNSDQRLIISSSDKILKI